MGDPKRQYTDGKKQFLITDREAAELNKGRPAYLPRIAPVDDSARVRSVFRNADGELVDEQLPFDQVEQRARMGENVVADATSIEQSRKETEQRDRLAMADEEDFTTLVNAALPFAQKMQNLAVGEDAANQARQDLNTNVAASLVGNLAEFAIGGKVISTAAKGLLGAERAAKLGVRLGLSKDSSKLAKVASVAGTEAAVDTHFYVQNQLDTGGEFEAEEWGRQVGTGLLFAMPFIGGAAGRGVGQAVRKAVGQSNALGTLRTAITTGAVLSAPGSMRAATMARGAAATGLVGKFFRRTKAKKGLTATDEAAQMARQIDEDLAHSEIFMTPEKLDRMAPSKRARVIEQFKRYADGDVDFLDGIKWETVTKRTRKMQTSVDQVRRATLSMHKKLQGDLVTEVKLPNTVRDQIIVQANEILKHAEDVGLGDVRGAIKRGVIGTDDVATMHKALFEARVNARFRRGVSAGADQIDDQLKAFLEDKTIWRGQAAKNAKLNAALDDVVQIWDDLGDVHIPKHLENVDINDGLALGKNQASIDKLRKSMDTLEEAGLISQKQRVDIETRLVDAGDAVREGTEAYTDVIKINRARKQAQAKLKKQKDVYSDVPETAEGFAATKAQAVMETATDMATWASKGLDAFLSEKPMRYGAVGVGAVSGMSAQEKYEVFDHIQREMVNLAGNPAYLTEKLGKQLDRGAAYDPMGADWAGQKAMNTLFYLQSQLPPQDDTIFGRGVPQPLSAVEEYLEKWGAAADPVSVGYEVFKGTLTPQMVDSVRVTSPNLFAQMQVELATIMSKVPAEKANPKVLSAASMFMGGLDTLYTGDFIAKIQSNYAQTETQDQVINGPRRPMPNPAPSTQATTSQRQQTY